MPPILKFTMKKFEVLISSQSISQDLDLLSKDPKNKLEIKENVDSGVYVKDLTSFVVKNATGLHLFLIFIHFLV